MNILEDCRARKRARRQADDESRLIILQLRRFKVRRKKALAKVPSLVILDDL